MQPSNCKRHMVQTEDGRWFCPRCDPQKHRTSPVILNRLCLSASRCTVQKYLVKAMGPPHKRDKSTFPPLITQFRSFTEAVKRWVFDGFKVVTSSVYRRRRSICMKCKFRKGWRCKTCGCNVKVKAWGRMERCPRKYW